ncbi:NADH-quinone oxidoreductase subunit L [Pseudoalteromonas denitrificans]|uniref:NADH dehydrogenase subunit L n=1 Tax=Pseudoalteromonas denitrificans DSM 6059 TaxID=1123010 RepID=A0A1I1P2Y5_9GAMM|nr:NADH-quinone oxidoreductase subunit L [Pseudoalteromonas denitrificans]SFD04314.1 NADH dehydrogenase subunit L [Pseudoalteromonas denitrificans DSM 6059]
MTYYASLLSLIPLLPLFSALILLFSKPNKLTTALLAVGSISGAACISLFLNFVFWQQTDFVLTSNLGNWIKIAQLHINFSLYLDALSLVMITIITGVGALIHLYSIGFMYQDKDFKRYFTYLNLFVSAMLFLVLADNLLLLYLGWEGVGLCSYLLIGFWYQDRDNNLAANKAFLMTRIGDTAMALGLFLLFIELGTLNIQDLQVQALSVWSSSNNNMANLCCLLLLGGALGKSAQFPLQNWLPDAMAGPTPVSALIHAATMVTAGIYLIARNSQLFQMAPDVMYLIAFIGTITLLLGASAAMVQSDLKRILAYSTISQLGYMFLALGVGAGASAVFHLMTHAFFKALLFLSAGALIYSLHHEHNIFKMGGLLKKLPIVATSFAIGCAALASLPFTSGFFSKELILEQLIDSGHTNFWWAAVLGAFITAFYSARLFFVVFLGDSKQSPDKQPEKIMSLVLLLLCFFSLFGGIQPSGIQTLMPKLNASGLTTLQHWLPIVLPFIAISLAWWMFKTNLFGKTITVPALQYFHQLLKSGWAFDRIYQVIFVSPFKFLCQLNKSDIIDLHYRALEKISKLLHKKFSQFQNGKLRCYNASLIIFCVLAFAWFIKGALMS